MADIYQEIWNVDQAHAGLTAVHQGNAVSDAVRSNGYVVVKENQDAKRDHKLIEQVHIPPRKEKSYGLLRALLNNYTLDQTKSESSFPEEQKEVQEFLDYIHTSPPMEVAREYAAARMGQPVSRDQWWAILQRVWFEQFTDGKNRDLSGFEHVVVGEQKKGEVKGYHSWYKYYLDEHFRRTQEEPVQDSIGFLAWKRPAGDATPDVATLSFNWRAFDYEAGQFRPLTKPVGGFWIGPSTEGMMAIGTVRFLPEVMAPKRAEINGYAYDLPLYRSPNDRHLRTFFPAFVERVKP